ncbi:hypothetical protein QRD43_08060 [Pelomonas sp. APW6]|uniref:Uncharacterized protein n=1 Tax=Roseateles subflavus TaxID=3053353 RepID=A0ABT7LG80_9BURK|nr:hypothetical protein [Pelomonas sp. APW6]MDL5031861.1 hypothetical protein [Pelomonas sp. APW6]
MRALLPICLLPLSLPLQAAEVSLKIHTEMDAWASYDKPLPKPSWNKDGTLSAWALGHGTGSESIVETGARVVSSKQALHLCYATRQRTHAPGEPIPAIAFPMVLEFRVRGLPRGDYVVRETGACR